MWANSVWGLLTLGVGFWVAVAELAPEWLWLRPWFSWTGSACLVGSATVLCWPLWHADVREQIRVKLQHPLAWMVELIEPHHLIIAGLFIALVGAVWNSQRTDPAPVASTTTSSNAQLTGDPFRDKLNAYLVKHGQPASRVDDGSIHLGSFGYGDPSPFISYWNVDVLGPWPTEKDGFTEGELRIFPAVVPKFSTQYEREKFRAAIDYFSNLINEKIGRIISVSDNFGQRPVNGNDPEHGSVAPLKKLQELRELYAAVDEQLGAGGNIENGSFFNKTPIPYKAALMGLIPRGSWQKIWVDYGAALVRFQRAVQLLEFPEKHPENGMYNQVLLNIDMYQDIFIQASSALKNWVYLPNKRVELLVKSMQ
jgi:hypothetical protein